MIRLEIEFAFRYRNHMERVYRYDDDLGCMVRGFQFRLKPIFMAVLWRAK